MTKKKNIFLFVLVTFIFLVFLALKSGLFTIKRVELEADKLTCANEDQIKNVSHLVGQNFFLLDKVRLIKELKEKFICIKDIHISRSFPAGIKMEIIQREPAAILLVLKDREATGSAQIKDYYLADSEGITFSKDVGNLSLPKVYVQNLNTSLTEKVIKILDKIKTSGIEIDESFLEDSTLSVNSKGDKTKIIFNLTDKLDIQIASLQLILEKAKIDERTLEFIDLRFDKPVVKFAPKKNG